ncbi:MAG: putative lipid II flippase FtsW [Candidatus Sungbacteria bacterium]|nr:putative lipid II flippase FtsW [Candidatus Sungbacteria bacterium]
MSHSIDRPFVYALAILFVGGMLILASASVVMAQKNFGSVFFYTFRQFLYGGIIGGAALLTTQWIPYRAWKKLALPMMIVSFVLLAFLFIPHISYSAGGARRWLQFGFFSFQPSEVLKFAFVVYLASWLDARRGQVKSVSYGMLPFSLMLAVVGIFLVMEPDIGTLGVVIGTAVLLYFLGGGKISQIATLCMLGLAVLYLLVQLAPYRLSRILVFLQPGLDPRGIGYQINQAFIAIGSGGFWGLGFGKSLQKYSYLPEPMGDSIFAIFAEETGFIGVAAFVVLMGFLLWRGMLIARRAPDTFGKLLASGIIIGVMVQSFINIAAISGLLPLTGIPLPLVSYGGTSLAITLAGFGVLLNISKYG